MNIKFITSYLILLFFVIAGGIEAQGQNKVPDTISGKVLNAANNLPLGSVNIINLNQVKGTITENDGSFKIPSAINDTLYLTYLGFKPIKVRVTEDWKKYGNVKIKMTEVGFALEEVTVKPYNLTGYIEIDAKNIPIFDNSRYQISGLNRGYEAGSHQPSGVSKALSSIFNPADLLHNIFGNKPRQMRKLREMKKSDEIQRLLESKFDRQTLAALLQVDKSDINKILRNCNYSKSFIKSANDLQILDAISACYENYRAVNE